MIVKKIEVNDTRELRRRENTRFSLLGFFFSLPWCCITPAALSLLGFFGAAGATRLLLKEILFPLFLVSFLLLGRANYLSFYRRHGSRISRVVVLVFTILALALWVFRFGLIPI